MNQPTTVRGLLNVASTWLGEQGVDEARLNTEHLLAHVLGCRRLDLYLDVDRPLSVPERDRFRGLMRRRGAERIPLAYLLGTRGFMGHDFKVAPGVLIPRPDTETLVLAGRDALQGLEVARFADVGTGSGCVALSLLALVERAQGVGIDVSPDALELAAQNKASHPAGARLELRRASLLDGQDDRSLELVLSNPPYITPSEHGLLAPEVKDHEPAEALFDEEGLPLTRRLVDEAARVLVPGGTLALETGFDKAALVAGFLRQAGYEDVRTLQDLGEIERVVVGRRPA
ncbi:MAG: peptide chain release factor N(5)-glutamine methyltransferase [Planctomycetota bacterium]